MSRYRLPKPTPPAPRTCDRWVSHSRKAPDLPTDDAWSEAAWERDERRIKLFARGLLKFHDASKEGLSEPDRIWLLSRTTLAIAETELLPGCEPQHELVGGWVTRQQAILEYPQYMESVGEQGLRAVA